MKVFASLLISVSLVLGTIAGACAYLPKVAAIDPADQLILAAPAGVHSEDASKPLFDPKDHPVVLTTDVLEQLMAANVKRVRVKSFAFKRWSLGYLFGLSCLGLMVGAWLIRREAKRSVSSSVHADPESSPEAKLREALQQLQQLRATTAGMNAPDARRQIIDQLDQISRNKFDGFVESRPALVSRLGMAGYARLMDRFAAAERQLNRAWSAAADHVLDESRDCLAAAEIQLQETIQRLSR